MIMIVIGLFAILAILVAFSSLFILPKPKLVSTVIQDTPISSEQYKPEVIPFSSTLSASARTSTPVPANTHISNPTPIITRPPISLNKSLPDLVVTGISDPVCESGYVEDVLRDYLKFKVVVRNIGRTSTHSFDVNVYILVGSRSYPLSEWANKFNGVIGSPNILISNIEPSKDATFTLAIDISGITKFGIKVVANSGVSPIPELDMANNTLIKYFQFTVISFAGETCVVW